MSFKKIGFLALILLILFSTSGVVSAMTPSNLSWPTSPLGTEVTEICVDGDECRPGKSYFREDTDIPTVVQYFFEWMIVLGGLAAFIAFIWAGLLYMTSVGDANKMNDAKKKIKKALIGLVLLMSSWLIFNTINPELTALGELPLIEIDREEIDEGVQDRIANFTKTYVKCKAKEEINRRLVIHVPIPLLTFEIPVGEFFDLIGKAEEWTYEGFTGTVTNCDDLARIIREENFPVPFNIKGEEVRNYQSLIRIINLDSTPMWWE